MLSLHLIFDDSNSAFTILGFQFEHGYNNNSTFIWFILVHLIPLLLFSLWFLNTVFWWRYFIFFPMFPSVESMYSTFYEGPGNYYYGLFFFICFIAILLYVDKIIAKRVRKGNGKLIAPFLKMVGKDYEKLHQKVKKLLNVSDNEAYDFSKNKRAKKLYHTQTVLEEEIKSYKIIDNSVFVNKKVEPFILGVLILTPFIFYSYLLVPKQEQILDFDLFSIGNYGFVDVRAFLWYVYVKFCVLIALCVWFITSANWWRYSLFSPIIIYAYQLWEAVQDEILLVDETAYLDSLPIMERTDKVSHLVYSNKWIVALQKRHPANPLPWRRNVRLYP